MYSCVIVPYSKNDYPTLRGLQDTFKTRIIYIYHGMCVITVKCKVFVLKYYLYDDELAQLAALGSPEYETTKYG